MSRYVKVSRQQDHGIDILLQFWGNLVVSPVGSVVQAMVLGVLQYQDLLPIEFK